MVQFQLFLPNPLVTRKQKECRAAETSLLNCRLKRYGRAAIGRCGLVAILMDIYIPSLELTNGIMRDKYVSGQ